jgi:aminoglycoside phosphotransferase (APT) family kinase protein
MLNEGALRDYLRDRLPGADRPLTIEPLRGGQSNPTFRLRFGSQSYVLRKRPEGTLLPSAHAVDREYRVMSALAKTDVPVPAMRCYCDDVDVIGTPFFLMDYVDGRVFRDPALPELDRPERAALWDDVNSVIARLHCVDYDAVGLSDYGKPGNYFERQIGRWTRQYRASETERIESMDRLIDWLPANIPPGEDTSIVHGDFRIDNLIVHPTQPRVIAVLDWELSTLGSPLADFSYHMMAWRLTQQQFRGMAQCNLAALGIPGEREYIRAYCRRTGRNDIDARHWEFYMAFSMFRMTAILQGIARRAIDGTSADPHAREVGQRARAVADVAWTHVERMLGARK